jgi:peptidoglycan-associated lipoprotein
MSRKSIAGVGVLALSMLILGCPKKAPTTPAEDLTTRTTTVPPPSAQEITRPDAAASTTDPVESPLDKDLQSVNQYVAGQGLIGDVFFDFDRYELRADARERLAKNAEWLRQNRQFVLTIEGHCDERDTNEYNLALGERRANATRDYLQSLGVPAERLRTISYGEERPFCSESHEGCWQQNRRAHFVITGRTSVG